MGDEVVTRADREAVSSAFREAFGDELPAPEAQAWVESGQHEDSADPDVVASSKALARTIARVRIAAERAGYERGVREERERVERYLRTTPRTNDGALVGISHSHVLAMLADDIAIGEHAKEGA